MQERCFKISLAVLVVEMNTYLWTNQFEKLVIEHKRLTSKLKFILYYDNSSSPNPIPIFI